MSIDQVIELGNIDYDTAKLAWRYWIWWAIIFVLLVIEVFVWIGSHDDYEDMGARLSSFGIACVVFLLLCLFNWGSDSVMEEKLIEQWKAGVAYPFIAQIPEDKKEIIYIKIDPELSHKVSGGMFYTYSNEIHRTPLTVSFKANGIETYTDWYETHMELTNEQQPHITFKRLEKNLGHGVNKGIYDAKVYLPDTYKFTDIK